MSKQHQKPTCPKCVKTFSSQYSLTSHMNRKIPCDRTIKCGVCQKQFTRLHDLKKHQNRKTSCEPIQGNPIEQVPPLTCHFCYKLFKNKYSLKRHFNTCKIMNGGMALLFKRVEQLENENRELKKQITIVPVGQGTANATIGNVTGNNNNVLNHTNTNFTFNFIGFHDCSQQMIEILKQEAPKILYEEKQSDVSYAQQVQSRIQNLVTSCYRNPDYKELQNVYVTDPSKPKDNAFIHDEGKWNISSWDDVNKKILNKMYNNLVSARIKKREDKLKLMKHIFVLGGCGNADDIEKMTDDEVEDLYFSIGRQLNFETIVL